MQFVFAKHIIVNTFHSFSSAEHIFSRSKHIDSKNIKNGILKGVIFGTYTYSFSFFLAISLKFVSISCFLEVYIKHKNCLYLVSRQAANFVPRHIFSRVYIYDPIELKISMIFTNIQTQLFYCHSLTLSFCLPEKLAFSLISSKFYDMILH